MDSSHKLDALFVGYENQENLGLRYIMAYIEASGFRSALVPYTPGDPTNVLEAAKQSSPDLIGFSIIFQYNLHEFGELMEMLRQKGVGAHFTAGGHYPSLRPVRTLGELKHLDSIVIFEGELTTAELLSKLDRPREWPGILGLVFRREEEIVINQPRPLVTNLDELPWPRRGEIRQSSRGRGMAPILASRGCLYNCSFCSIRQFYAGAPGPLRRIRSPRDVAAEMNYLYKSRGIRLFLFQDDDFAAKSKQQLRWIEDFLHELETTGLKGKIGWKVSCRVDDIQSGVMARCRDHGLLVVYLGVESGSRLGLKTLNKHVTVEQNLAAMHTLKDVGLEFDMGFMLFDPDSTMDTVRENLHFLRQVAGMGGPPISFVKMLPLAGTSIEDRLIREKRLTGSDIRPDYDLLDPRLDYYALFVALNFSFHNSDPNGLVERLRQAYFDCLVVRTFEQEPWTEHYRQILRTLCDRANQSTLDVLDQALDLVENCPDGESVALAWPRLRTLAAREHQIQSEILYELDRALASYNQGLYQAFKNKMAG